MTAPAAYDYRWLASEVEENFTLNDSSTTKTVNGKTWYRKGGTIAVSSSGFTLANGRFLIGSQLSPETSSSVYDSAGEFNFASTKKKVTIDYSNFTGTAKFQIYLNNSTAAQGNSVHGNSSQLIDTDAYSDSPGQITVTIDSAAFTANSEVLATSFLQLRAASGATIVITGITIEDADE
jgi:hypothetical protein